VNPGTGKSDLIELRAMTKGNIKGIVIQKDIAAPRPVTLADLPSLEVEMDDLIVVHLKAKGSSESTNKNQCSDPACFDMAWDIFESHRENIGNSARVVVLRGPKGEFQDALAFYSEKRTGFAGDVRVLQRPPAPLAAAWKPADCGGAPCDDTTVKAIVVGTHGVRFKDGVSIGRISDVDTDTQADWAAGPDTFGRPNP
jgi:hypothetical protein